MNITLPDYTRSLLQIPNSILAHYGVAPFHKTLPELDEALGAGSRRVILMLFDGMGIDMLTRHLPADSFLRSHLVCPLSSVFPPTTMAAETTVQSGLSPIEHGHLGWDLWFDEMGENYQVFGRRGKTSGRPYAAGDPGELFLHYDSIRTLIARENPELPVHYLAPFTPPYFRTLRDYFRLAADIAREDGSHFLYAYWMNPDHDAHELGVGSPKTGRILRDIDRGVERFCRGLTDTTLIITADHGMVDVDMIWLSDYPELTEMFAHEPSIESRATAFFIKDECRQAFPAAFDSLFGDRFRLYTAEEALAAQLLGPGNPHPRSRSFMGDFLACSTSSASFGMTPDPHPLKALHAGLTADENRIPLIIVRT